jgi:hypothetical protein
MNVVFNLNSQSIFRVWIRNITIHGRQTSDAVGYPSPKIFCGNSYKRRRYNLIFAFSTARIKFYFRWKMYLTFCVVFVVFCLFFCTRVVSVKGVDKIWGVLGGADRHSVGNQKCSVWFLLYSLVKFWREKRINQKFWLRLEFITKVQQVCDNRGRKILRPPTPGLGRHQRRRGLTGAVSGFITHVLLWKYFLKTKSFRL